MAEKVNFEIETLDILSVPVFQFDCPLCNFSIYRDTDKKHVERQVWGHLSIFHNVSSESLRVRVFSVSEEAKV